MLTKGKCQLRGKPNETGRYITLKNTYMLAGEYADKPDLKKIPASDI